MTVRSYDPDEAETMDVPQGVMVPLALVVEMLEELEARCAAALGDEEYPRGIVSGVGHAVAHLREQYAYGNLG